MMQASQNTARTYLENRQKFVTTEWSLFWHASPKYRLATARIVKILTLLLNPDYCFYC